MDITSVLSAGLGSFAVFIVYLLVRAAMEKNRREAVERQVKTSLASMNEVATLLELQRLQDREKVREIQSDLAAKGEYFGPIDGIPGPRTAAALAKTRERSGSLPHLLPYAPSVMRPQEFVTVGEPKVVSEAEARLAVYEERQRQSALPRIEWRKPWHQPRNP